MASSLFPKGLAHRAGLFLFAGTALAGCATYQSKVSVARDLMTQGKAEEAVQKLEPLAQKDDGDQLVYLLDYATALQVAGDMKKSNDAFLRADKLAEAVDYHSVSRLTGSMLLNEEVKQYKGDTFEKIFINAELAVNYLGIGKMDDALVEARRMNEKYVKLRSEEKKEFELNPFAKYLSAVAWEADHEYDDAIIAYQEAEKISPNIEFLPEDLIRVSKLARRTDDYQAYKKKFPHIKEKPEWYDRKMGELIVIVQQGWGPRKVFDRGDARFPDLTPVFSETRHVRADIKGVGSFPSGLVYDVQSAAIKTLADDRASLMGRRLAAYATKSVAADQIRQKNELLGILAYFALQASDRADLRQWSTLPETVQFVRTFVKAGDYEVDLQGLNSANQPSADRLENKKVSVQAGKKTFLVWRTLH